MQAEAKRRALFLDRDGVVNVEVHRLHDPRDLVLIPGVAEAIATVNGRGVPVVVITNQSGIGRGLYSVSDYQAVQAKLAQVLAASGAHIDAAYFCPHAPNDDCGCRKPRPGMLQRAAEELGLTLAGSVMVGDKKSDLQLARAVGCRAILVRTGYGRGVEEELRAAARTDLFDACFDDLPSALPRLLDPVGDQAWWSQRSPTS